MKNKPSFLLLIIIIASSVNSSEGYGTKKFSQSFSSSSASSHASSYSSSSSYTVNGGHNPEQLAVIEGIPKVKAIATASASAGDTSAIANAAASAQAHAGAYSYSHNAGGDQVVQNTVGSGSQSGSASYSIGASHSTTSATTNKNIESVSYLDTHRPQNIFPTSYQVNDGSYLAGDHYSASTANNKDSSGTYSYRPGHDQQVSPIITGTEGQSGSTSYSVGSSKANTGIIVGDSSSHKNGIQQLHGSGSQVRDSSNSAKGYGSSKASNAHVSSGQYTHNLSNNDHVVPNKIGTIGQSGNELYSVGNSKSEAGSNIHSTIGDGRHPHTQGSHNSVGTGSQVGVHSYSGGGQTSVNVANINMGANSYSNDHGKHDQEAPNKIGTSSQSNSGSYSSGSSSFPATRNTYTILGGGTTSYNQGRYNTIGSESQVKDGLYPSGNYDSSTAKTEYYGSNYYNGGRNNQRNDGSYSAPATNIGAGSYSNNKYNTGSYDVSGNGNVGKESSYSSGFNYGTAAVGGSRSDQSDYSFGKKYFQTVDYDTLAQYVPRVYPKEVIPKDKKNIFPGPDGSIYDYKVPTQHNNVLTAQSNSAQSASFEGSQSVASSGNTHTKPCCKGPFPGPSGSIYESKPASAIGTAVKTSVSHPPLTRVTSKIPIASFPGPSGSIYLSKPANIDNGSQNNNEESSIGSSGTYQKQFGSSSLPVSPCTKSSCTKVTKLMQQTTPTSYLRPPVVKNKPTFESVEEELKPNINKYVPSTPSNTIPLDVNESSSAQNYKPQTIIDNTRVYPEGIKKIAIEKSITNLSQTQHNEQSTSVFSGIESNINSGFSGKIVPTERTPQKFDESFSTAGANSHSDNSQITPSIVGTVILGNPQATPIDISTTIEKQVPKVYMNGNRDVIAEPVDISTTIDKQVPKVYSSGIQQDSKFYTNGIRNSVSNPAVLSTTVEKEIPKVYTNTVYIDLKKPSTLIDSDRIIFDKPTSFNSNGLHKNTKHFVSDGSHEIEALRKTVNSGIAFSSSGSNSYGSSSSGFSSTGCNIPGCGTSYKQYANVVPSQGAKKPLIHIDTIPSSGYSLGKDKFQNVAGSYAGSYGSQTTGNGYGTSSHEGSQSSSSVGSYGGTFPKKSITSDDGSGGFLSSIFLHGGPGYSSHADSLAKAGSFSSSRSYSKANSYASGSSFASSSSGSYSSHHY